MIVTLDASISSVFEVYHRYELGSWAKLNRSKSKGLWLGAWKDCSDTPHGLDWVQHLPVLGAVLSASDYTKEGRSLSYQGRALIINALALS